MPGRNYSSDEYRYGFNGMEKDDEVKGSGNSLDFGARMLDPRIGRWFARDPLSRKYSSFSPYNFVTNNPIAFIDPDGREVKTAQKNNASIIVFDLNSIFKAKYGVENAFKVEIRTREIQVLVNPVVLSEPSTWLNAFDEDKYETKTITEYYIKTNEASGFDFDGDGRI